MENNTQKNMPAISSAHELCILRDGEASTAKSRISELYDLGTFAETGAFAHKLSAELGGLDEGELEGVITGYGAIDGRLVFAFAQDPSRMKGALGAMHARKICDLYELAIKNGAPVIGIFDSAGAYVMEGVEALAGYGKIMKKVSDASGVIPQIALIAGNCGGAMSTIASMFDIAVGVKGAELYVNPPFVMNELDRGAGFGKIETAAKKGEVGAVCDSMSDALAYIRKLLSYIPQNNTDGTAYLAVADEINRLTPDVRSIVGSGLYNMADVISAISDNAEFFEISAEWAKTMLVGFATLNGVVIGVAANQPSHNGGKITACAARKAARFISFCDCFKIPLLTLVDTEGYDVRIEAEKAQYGAALAKLASAYASSENAKVTVVLGKAYGAAYTLMGSKAIGADITFASTTAKISAMPTKSAVAFAWSDKVTDNAKRAELEAEWDSVMASPVVAAKAGEIDDIIDLDELRLRVAAAFEMLGAKNELCAKKRHSNLPL